MNFMTERYFLSLRVGSIVEGFSQVSHIAGSIIWD